MQYLKKRSTPPIDKSMIKYLYHNLNFKGDAHGIHRIGFTQKKYFCNSFNGDGKILSRTKIGPNTKDICYYLKSQGNRSELSVAKEVLYNWQYYCWAADTVVLAHPLKTRIIGEAKIKTDKTVSKTLAYKINLFPITFAYICFCVTKW